MSDTDTRIWHTCLFVCKEDSFCATLLYVILPHPWFEKNHYIAKEHHGSRVRSAYIPASVK